VDAKRFLRPARNRPPWDAYTDDHLGLMDTWASRSYGAGPSASAAPSSGNLLRRAPERLVADCAGASQRLPPRDADLFYQNNIKGWGPALCARRPEMTMDMVDAFPHKMYARNADFVLQP